VVTIKQLLKSTVNRQFFLVGTGLTRADAYGEFSAKRQLTVGTEVNPATVSDVLTAGEIGALLPLGAGDAGNAVLVMHKAGTRNKVVRMAEVTKAVALANGTINTAHAYITAFETAYSDGDGNKGYTALKGRFTRK
jgi:hypothetical protein